MLLTSCGGWSKKDSALELGFAGITTVDWVQSKWIAAACREQNPIIGRCGQRVPVDLYFPIAMLVHVSIALILPPTYRTLWQAAYIGAEANQVWGNYRK